MRLCKSGDISHFEIHWKLYVKRVILMLLTGGPVTRKHFPGAVAIIFIFFFLSLSNGSHPHAIWCYVGMILFVDIWFVMHYIAYALWKKLFEYYITYCYYKMKVYDSVKNIKKIMIGINKKKIKKVACLFILWPLLFLKFTFHI